LAEFSRTEGLTIVRLTEQRLDAARAPSLKAALNENIQDQPERIVVDAGELQFMDSTGLGVIVSLLKLMGGNGRLAIVCQEGSVRKLLKITKLDQIVRPFPTLADAIAALER
jgi:anti-sigma B factor antagonist